MNLDTLERWIRRASNLTAVLFLVIIYAGFWQITTHTQGRTTGIMPGSPRKLFGLYALSSMAVFGILKLLCKPIGLTLTAPARAIALAIGTLLYYGGILLTLWGRLELGSMYGVSTGFGASLYTGHRLITTGPFAVVRHPMYLGVQLAALGALFLYRRWSNVFLVISYLGLYLRARREENVLEQEFGPQWRSYRSRVPAWLPRIGKS
jgi:protein-S-isoprenylcysteine O-methyltransferase Ste14